MPDPIPTTAAPRLDLVAAWKAAYRAWDDARGWAGAHELTELTADKRDAARALIRAAAGRHRIEQRVTVELVLSLNGWTPHPVTWDDEEPLAGFDDIIPDPCQHDDGDPDLVDECDALYNASFDLGAPTGRELFLLMAAAIGRPTPPGDVR